MELIVNAIPNAPIVSAGSATTFCSGGSVVLTSSAASGNVWSTGATTQSITVSASGTYTVNTSNAASCTSANSNAVTVTVNPLPAAPTVTPSGPTSFCAGSSVVLSSNVSSGNLWSTGETTQSITVSSSGTYFVNVTDGNGCTSSKSPNTVVTVNPLPAAPTISAIGPTSFCSGSSVTLSANFGSGITWSDGSTGSSIVVSQSGVYTATYTDANGCTSVVSNSISVTELSLPAQPTISYIGSNTICQGSSLVLTSSSPSGNIWSTGETTQSITVSSGGVYNVSVTNANNCTSPVSSNVVVFVSATPNTPTVSTNGSTSLCPGDDVVLTSSYSNGNVWSTGQTSQSITVSSAGSYSVTYINGNGCSSASSSPTVVTNNPAPNAAFSALASTYCSDDALLSLTPVVSGGSFSGTGVSGNTFDPSAVPSSMWGTAISITYTLSVNGCTSSSSQSIIVDDCANPISNLRIKILLEGNYQMGSSTMHTQLNQAGLIPSSQPYNQAPWNYNVITNAASIPANAVDWVLVEARTGTPSTSGTATTVVVERQAGLLLTDGNIVSADGSTGLDFLTLTAGADYYFSVRHRNHLDVLTAVPITATSVMNYDFTSSDTQAFGVEQVKLMTDGKYVLYAGDYNVDGVIQTTDYDDWIFDPSILNTYFLTDGNLDGVVQTTDFDTWFLNKAKIGSVEIQY